MNFYFLFPRLSVFVLRIYIYHQLINYIFHLIDRNDLFFHQLSFRRPSLCLVIVVFAWVGCLSLISFLLSLALSAVKYFFLCKQSLFFNCYENKTYALSHFQWIQKLWLSLSSNIFHFNYSIHKLIGYLTNWWFEWLIESLTAKVVFVDVKIKCCHFRCSWLTAWFQFHRPPIFLISRSLSWQFSIILCIKIYKFYWSTIFDRQRCFSESEYLLFDGRRYLI